MSRRGIKTVEDLQHFFNAFNQKSWERVFQYMREDCLWNASERQLSGKEEIIRYWTHFHSAFTEKLGSPENIVIGDGKVYLQVPIHLNFIEDCDFLGRSFTKGDSFDFRCADYYELDDEGMIKFGLVFIKIPTEIFR